MSNQPTNPHNLPRAASPSNQSTSSHNLLRVASPLTYAEKTINPNIRRRKARKKALARDSFSAQTIETVDNAIPILPPPIETPNKDITIPTIPPQIESPTLSHPIEPPSIQPTIKVPSIPPPVDLPPEHTSLSIDDVVYKFLKFFQVIKTAANVFIMREKLLR